MSFLLKDAIHSSLVDSVYSEILTRNSNYYYFIGRVMEWDDPDNPDEPLSTGEYEHETRNSIISVKKITIADISYVVRRIDWLSGTVYDEFDPDYTTINVSSTEATSLKTSDFYVLTDEFNVYKCLFNKNGAASTVKPTGTDALPISTADGYLWKFMYTIPLALRNRFLTDTLMPVQRSIQNAYYSNGEADRVTIDNKGSGYFGNAATTLSVNGTFGPSPNLAGTVSLTLGNTYVIGSGTAFTTDFSTGNTIVFTSNSNSYTVSSVLSSNVITLTTGYLGSTASGVKYKNYSKNSNVVANLTPVFNSSGSLIDVIIRSAGNNYVSANVSINDELNQGTGYYNTASTANIVPILYNTKVDRVVINDPGIGYSSNIQTSISSIGDGSGATFVPFINSAGELEKVIITNRGNGYSYLDISVAGDGTGANAFVELSTGDVDTTQSSVELAAINGAIYNIKIDNGGNNYSNANVVVTGDGTGFVGSVVLSNTNTVSYVSVTNPGSGYTYANVIINGSGTGANAHAIIAPLNGHGSDAVKELFADSVMLFSTINNERVHGVDVNNDYRQFGILKDLKQFGNKRAFANTLGTPCFLVTLDTVSGLTSDMDLQLVSDTTRKFEIIEVVSSTKKVLLLSKNNYTLQATDTLSDPDTSSTYVVSTVDNLPTINKFTGELIFIDNRTKVSYSDDQLVTLRTVIKL